MGPCSTLPLLVQKVQMQYIKFAYKSMIFDSHTLKLSTTYFATSRYIRPRFTVILVIDSRSNCLLRCCSGWICKYLHIKIRLLCIFVEDNMVSWFSKTTYHLHIKY